MYQIFPLLIFLFSQLKYSNSSSSGSIVVVVVVVFVVVYVVFSSDQGWKARPAPGTPACGGGEEILMCWEIRLIYQMQLHFRSAAAGGRLGERAAPVYCLLSPSS